MVFGTIAFLVYACTVCHIIMRHRLTAAIVATASILLWLAIALSLETVVGR